MELSSLAYSSFVKQGMAYLTFCGKALAEASWYLVLSTQASIHFLFLSLFWVYESMEYNDALHWKTNVFFNRGKFHFYKYGALMPDTSSGIASELETTIANLSRNNISDIISDYLPILSVTIDPIIILFNIRWISNVLSGTILIAKFPFPIHHNVNHEYRNKIKCGILLTC